MGQSRVHECICTDLRFCFFEKPTHRVTEPFFAVCCLRDHKQHIEKDLVKITVIWEVGSYLCLSLSLVTPFILSIIVHIFHRQEKFYGCDKPNYVAIFSLFWHIGDLYSDVIFAFVLIFQKNKLWYLATTFVVVPYMSGAVVLLKHIHKWNNSSSYISSYIQRYDAFLITVTIVSGFYTCVELARSKIFYMDRFYLALNRKEYMGVQNFKFFNIILLEYVVFCMVVCLCVVFR